MPLRFAFSLVLAALALSAASAAAAPDAATGVSPGLVHRGQKLTITLATKAKACSAFLQYADGNLQQLPLRPARSGVVTFVVKMALDAPIGPGRWGVFCGTTLKRGSFIVVATKSTTASLAPRVVVDRQGFSQRPDGFGTGSQISYGLLLRNTSATEDAKNVYVIVNMVDAAGELIGSKSRTVSFVPAGGTFAFGDSMSLRSQVATAKLEITIRVGAHEPKQKHPVPDLANVRILPSLSDPGWVSEVDGEIVNDTTPLTLQSATLSIVILDAAGVPVGGGTGYSAATLPSGARFVFTAQSGFTPIVLGKAASAVISVEPQYSAAL